MISNIIYKNFFTTITKFNIYFETNFKISQIIPEDLILVFNYGLVCNFQHFKFQLEYFQNLGYKTMIYDYRYHYKSSSGQDIKDCNFKMMAQDLHEIITSLNSPNIVLLGHSMGSNIGVQYLCDFPLRVKGFVSISGTHLAPQKVMFNSDVVERVQPLIEKIANANKKIHKLFWTTSHYNKLVVKIVHLLGFHWTNVPDEFVELYIKRIGELDPFLFFQLLNEMKKQNLTKEINNSKIKVLVMGGDKDYIIPLKHQKEFCDLFLNSQFYIIKDGSHVPQVDFFRTVNDRIHQFLTSL